MADVMPPEAVKTEGVPVKDEAPLRTPQQIAWDRLALVERAHKALAEKGAKAETEVAPSPSEYKEAEKKPRGQAAIPFEQEKMLQPFAGKYTDEQLLQRYRKETGQENVGTEDFPVVDGKGGIQQAAREVPALFGIQDQGLREGEEQKYDDRPMEGQYLPVQGGGITMSDGSIQKGSSEYPIGPAYARLSSDFEESNPGEVFRVGSVYGAIRSVEENFQRVLGERKHWENYFTEESIARGSPTKADLLPGKWEDLQRSPHVHANAADISLSSDIAKYGTVLGKDGKSYPSEAAMFNSSQGKWMYGNDSYNLLIRGWVPAGKGYGASSGITEDNTGRKELWHIEYNPEAARDELERLGFLDEDGFLKPPIADPTSRNQELVNKAGAASLYSQTPDEDLAEVTTSIQQTLEQMQRDFPDENLGQIINRWGGGLRREQEKLSKRIQETLPLRLEAEEKASKAKAEVERLKAAHFSLEKSLREQKTGMAKATAGALEQVEKDRASKADGIMANMDNTADKIRGMDINAFRQFQFVKPKLDEKGKPVLDEDGEPVTELNPLKTAYTIAAGIALLANAFFTFKSSARKKGNKVPFLVWDMIMQSVNLDLRNQEAALQGEHAKLNADHNRLGDWNNYFGNKETALLKQKELFFGYVEEKIKEGTAHWKDAESRMAVDTILAESKNKRAQIKLDIQGLVTEAANNEYRAQLEPAISVEGVKSEKQELLIKAIGASVRVDARKSKKLQLTSKQKDAQAQAFKFLPIAKELQQLWKQAGSDKNLILKGMARTGAFSFVPKLAAISGDAYALEKMRQIQQQYAAVLTKAMGEVGALAEKEQIRAMSQIPISDSRELGAWKLERLMLSMKLVASDQFYVMDSKTRQVMINEIFKQPDTMEGVKYATSLMDDVTRLWDNSSTQIKQRKELGWESGAATRGSKESSAISRRYAPRRKEKEKERLAKNAKLAMENRKRLQKDSPRRLGKHPGVPLGGRE
tara:strand:+ start:521 stop:3472 length:2952 start_codon:yes stop_codon:yes gene_type:complete